MKYYFLFLILIFTMDAKASAAFESNQSVRALGMGNAYITSVGPTDALFYNPAALAYVHGLNWELANVNFGVNGVDIYNSVKTIQNNSSTTSYSEFFGKNIWVGAGAKSAFVMPNFGIAGFSDNSIDIELHNPAYPQFNTYFMSDYGFLIGGAFNLAPTTSFGFTLKRISRWGGSQDVGVGTITSGTGLTGIKNSFQNKGSGYGADIALMYKIPVAFNPSFALVWKDVGCTSFVKTAGTEAPARIDDNLSLGMGTSVDLPGFDWYNSFDIRQMNNTTLQLGQKVHLGTEISLPLINVRAGLNEGYMTYGAGIDLFLMKLDAAYYAEETGVYPGQTPENRIQIGLSIDLSFDADFKFTDNNGHARKLKQRR